MIAAPKRRVLSVVPSMVGATYLKLDCGHEWTLTHFDRPFAQLHKVDDVVECPWCPKEPA